MQNSRWWHVAVLGTAVVQAVILSLSDPTAGIFSLSTSTAGMLALGGGTIVVFVVAWLTLGSRSPEGTAGSIIFIVITVASAGIVTLANPSLAIVQCIAFPLVWTRSRTIWGAIIANVGVAASTGTGLYLSAGSLAQAVVIEVISLAFSVGLGLWITGIANQSHERQRLLDELEAAQEQLALLNRDAGVTSERDRLAREIHDTIAQDLTGIVLVAQRASRELAAGDDPSASLELLEESARATLAETRALVASTASPGLEGGVAAAVTRLAERFQRETGIRVDVTSTGAVTDRAAEVVLVRVAQEGLANVRKHSGATAVTVRLDGRELEIRDNGHGFDATAESSGFGLAGMRDRLALVGGRLDIASGTTGTVVRVTA